MRKIKLDNDETIYLAPEDIWEMPLGRYLDLFSLYRDGEQEDSLGFQIKQASILSGIPMEKVGSLGWEEFGRLCELLTFEGGFEWPEYDPAMVYASDGDKARRKPVAITIDGEEYYFQPDYAYQSVATASQIEDLMRGRDMLSMLHFILAIALRRGGEVFDLGALNEKAKRMCELPLRLVFHPLMAFINPDQNCLLFERSFLLATPTSRKLIRDIVGKVEMGLAMEELRDNA